jgi:hypothetical protein
MGILGRRRARKTPETNAAGSELLARQLASPDPALRLLAVEAQILASEAKNAAPGTIVPFPAVRTIKERRNARVTGPPNPDPKRLRWDAEKCAFRLINPTCSGSHGHSALTGEKLTCGLCDGRAVRPKRFQPGSQGSACRYCGRVGEGLVCTRCDKIRAGFDAAHMSRHSIADRRGWTGPATIGDDELWVTIIRRLRDADHRRLALDEKDAWKAARERRTAFGYRSTKVADEAQDNPQKPLGPVTGATPEFEEAAE